MTTADASLLTELDRQVQRLTTLGYPALAGMSVQAFEALFEPLRREALTCSLHHREP